MSQPNDSVQFSYPVAGGSDELELYDTTIILLRY